MTNEDSQPHRTFNHLLIQRTFRPSPIVEVS